MKRLFKEVGKSDANTNKLVSDLVDKCKICRVFQKTKPRTKVNLRKSHDFNSVVSMDLKQLPKHDKYILYILCKFLGYIKGIVIKNKEASMVLENFEKYECSKDQECLAKQFFQTEDWNSLTQ